MQQEIKHKTQTKVNIQQQSQLKVEVSNASTSTQENSKQIIEKQKIKQKQNESQQQQTVKQVLKNQLISMQFQIEDIEEALTFCADIDKAIQFIIAKMQSQQNNQNQISKQVKLFLIARMDLKMGAGKIAAQVAHAVLKAFQTMRSSTLYSDQKAKLLVEWIQNGQKSKILKVQSQKQLYDLVDRAKSKSINCCYIRDAGRTQIAAGSTTVAAIGPIQEDQADFLFKLKEL